jgi:hypothetical protein
MSVQLETTVRQVSADVAAAFGISRCYQCGGPIIGTLTIVEVTENVAPVPQDEVDRLNDWAEAKGLPCGLKELALVDVHVVGMCSFCADHIPTEGHD